MLPIPLAVFTFFRLCPRHPRPRIADTRSDTNRSLRLAFIRYQADRHWYVDSYSRASADTHSTSMMKWYRREL